MSEGPIPEREITIADLFPLLPPAEQEAVRQTLDAYCELLFKIFQRMEREDRDDFDGADASP